MSLLFLIIYPLFAWYLFKKTKNKVKNIPWNIKFLGTIGFILLTLFVLYNNKDLFIFENDSVFRSMYHDSIMYPFSFLVILIVYIFTFFYYKFKYKDILENDVDFYLNQPYISKKEFIINLVFLLTVALTFSYSILQMGFKKFLIFSLSADTLIDLLFIYILMFASIASIYWFFATIEKYNKQRIIKKIKEKVGFEEKIREKLEEKK